MKLLMNRKMSALIAIFLMSTIAFSLSASFPVASAVIAMPDRPTGAYASVNPKVTGVNQDLTVNLWVYPSPNGPHGEGGVTSPYFFWNVSATFTRPDGSKDTFMPTMGTPRLYGVDTVPGQMDEVGGLWFYYKPNQVGQWGLSLNFPGNTFIAQNYSVYYKPSSTSITFTVQEDPVQITQPTPLPTPDQYWSRPISSQNREWYQISGEWFDPDTCFNPYSTGPESSHILWSRQEAEGGIIGGDMGSLSYPGVLNYIGRPGAWIMDGKVYYQTDTKVGTTQRCTDLRTGEVLWEQAGTLSQAQFSLVGSLRYAPVGEILADAPTRFLWSFSSSAWKRYRAYSGYMDTNIPVATAGLSAPVWVDDRIAYVWRAAPYRTNSSEFGQFEGEGGREYTELFKWNLTAPGTTWESRIVWRTGNLLDKNGLGPGESYRGSAITVWPDKDLVILTCTATGIFYGYDMDTGEQLWKHDQGWTSMTNNWMPDGALLTHDSSNMMYYCYEISRTGTFSERWSIKTGAYPWGSQRPVPMIAYGNIYAGNYDGYLYCYDSATGDEKWKFYAGDTTETPFGTWAIYATGAIADRKVYVTTSEHTPTEPYTRGNKLFCIDANTGEEIWHIFTQGVYYGAIGIAEGYLVSSDEYTGRLNCYGKGKTATTVSASPKIIPDGTMLMLEGTVMDMSPAQPNTPAVSDASMTAWMEYLHMTQPIPMNTTGVEVSLDAVDPNNNFVHIGTVTSDGSGMFKMMWEPEVPGEYTVIATFGGSKSYWPSSGETSVGVSEAQAAAGAEVAVQADNSMLLYGILAAVVIAIVIGLIAVVLVLRKK